MRRCLLAVTLCSAGCGREVAQTAFREPSEPEAPRAPSCAQPVEALPPTPAWAAGAVRVTPLVADSYGAGEGPGLWLAARDTYRVFLNGALIAEGASARSADFIPLSLLPGDNALSIAVWAATGTPLALLQLDELSQSYASDASWRVDTAPGEDFATVGNDPDYGSAASDYGRLGALPGCDPSTGFPQDSPARWIGPEPGSGSSAVLRRTIRIAPVGFGEAATGGDSSEATVVESWDDLAAAASDPDRPATILIPEGDYDFRRSGSDVHSRLVCPSFCTEDASKPQYTVLTSTETCPVEQVMMTLDERTLSLGSNKTIVGLGRGARLRGVSLEFGSSQNIIVRNLALYDVNHALIEAGDALGMDAPHDVWVDHVTTKWISDGHADIGSGSRGISLSWLHFDGLTTDACRGRHSHVSQIANASVTLSHCFFDHTDSHAPLVEDEQSRVHVLGNLIQDDDGYGVGAACGAQVLVEGTTFKAVRTPTTRRDCGNDTPPTGLISAPAGSNSYLADVGPHAGGDGQEPHDAVFEPAYDYALEPAEQAFREVQSRAGAGGPWGRPLALEP